MAVLGFFFLMLVWLAAVAWWIVSLVQVVRAPELAYRQTGREKTTWVLLVVLLGWLGTLIWWFGPRHDVLRAAARLAPHALPQSVTPAAAALPPASSPGPPAGWYPDPAGAGQRYWDGNSWTTYVG